MSFQIGDKVQFQSNGKSYNDFIASFTPSDGYGDKYGLCHTRDKWYHPRELTLVETKYNIDMAKAKAIAVEDNAKAEARSLELISAINNVNSSICKMHKELSKEIKSVSEEIANISKRESKINALNPDIDQLLYSLKNLQKAIKDGSC